MDIFGYVLACVNLILGIVVAILRNIDDQLLQCKDSIKKEFSLAYGEFANTIFGESVEPEELSSSLTRLRRFHFSSVSDIHKIGLVESFTNLALPITIALVVVGFLSLIIGLYVCSEDSALRRSLVVGAPSLVLVVQLLILVLIARFERYLKRMKNRYDNLEY